MNTKWLFLISTVITVFMIVFNFNISYASDIENVINGANNFLNEADDGQKIDDDKLQSVSDMIYNILVVLGMSIAVIISGILGIKFMIGSVEEKAQVKDSLIPFIIGCIVVFGAFSIWKIVVTIGRQL